MRCGTVPIHRPCTARRCGLPDSHLKGQAINIFEAPAEFRPVSIVLETQDELDAFLAIVGNVAENRINHTAPIIRAAVDMRASVLRAINQD